MGIGWWLAAPLLLGAPPALAAECKVEQIAELPVSMQGVRPIVMTGVNGKPAPLILDSGAFHSTISPAVAKALALPRDPTARALTLRGIGGASDAWVATVKQFSLAGATIPNVRFVVGGSDVGQTGLLGQNVLGIGDVEYDLPGGFVRLFRAQNCGKMAMAYWAAGKPYFDVPSESMTVANRHTVGAVELDGAKLRAGFDTGAGSTVVSLRAAARAGVRPGDPGVVRAGWASGLGGRVVQGWTAPFKLLRIGTEELHNVRLRVADIGIDVDMLIGADWFVSHRLYVANSQGRIYFTYTGGRLFESNARADTTAAVVAQTAAAGGAPEDAEAASRRGAMAQTQRDLPGAVEAFSRAIALVPQEPRYPLQRAAAYLQQRRPALALTDLDTTLRLNPADTRARLLRAQLRLGLRENAGALDDADRAAAALPPSDAERLGLGQFYTALNAFPQAIEQFDLWLRAHPGDARQGFALNGRCWARALAGTDLSRARGDCDAAVRAVPGNASFLDSRGLVRLRLGDHDGAIADYSAALAIAPRSAWSLYGRGLAEKGKGMADQSARDLAAAVAINPTIAARAARYGVR